MHRLDTNWIGFLALGALAFLVSRPVSAAAPSPAQVLKLAPSQEGVDYDRPKAEDVPRCKVSVKKFDGHVGWIVESPEGVLLRKFLDTKGDNVVDQWSYYKDGVEVYREISTKTAGKADQFRWLNTAGTRWGIDSAGGGKVTAWKTLSAEEATAEIVAALAQRDTERFARVLLTTDDVESLGLGKPKADALAAKVAKAATEFAAVADRQKTLTRESKWMQFSGNRPGVVPAGTDDSTRDIEVYENVVAIVETAGRHGQVQIGTLVRVGNVWKAIDAPAVNSDGKPEVAAAGFFFQGSHAPAGLPAGVPNEETTKIIDAMQGLDPGDPRRIESIQKLIDKSKSAEERGTWQRQLADTFNAGVQTGKMADGEARLQAMLDAAKKDGDTNLAAYIKLRMLTAGYAKALAAAKPNDFQKIQTDYLKNLEQFVADYAACPDAAEAMLQLGTNREYNGQDDEAKKWYERIGREFAESPQAKKAAGAATRLDCVGKALVLRGKGLKGDTVDLAAYRGKVVLVQYWATWWTGAKTDLATLKQLAAKYDKSLAVIGVSLDNNVKDLNAFLAENPLPWPQIYEEGGQDSRPATALGIITVPTMMLVDAQGKVVNRNIQLGEIEAELKKLVP